MKLKNWVSLLAVLSLAVSSIAGANVSLKNGNFFTGYTDVRYPGGFEPMIQRIYNSQTEYSGIFGKNWGNEYEVFLNVSADGSVVVHEYGGGAENRFSPANFTTTELDKAVERLFSVAQKNGLAPMGGKVSTDFKQKLRTDATFRNDIWEKLLVKKLIEPRVLAENTQLYSTRFSYQFITRVKDGYVRNYESGKVEKFNIQGKLVRISEHNGSFIDFSYDRAGRLEKLVDNMGRKMFFTYDTHNHVIKIDAENNKVITYKYNARDQLEQVKNVDGTVFGYKYDTNNLMTEIDYSDNTSMKIAYSDVKKFLTVKSVKERDGTITEYDYAFGQGGSPSNTAVKIAVKTSDGKVISNSKYEYFIKNRVDGEEYTQRMVTTLDGEVTETVYGEQHGLPLTIKRGTELTSFEYDRKGRVLKKATPYEITQLTYDAKAGKVSKVVRTPKDNPKGAIWSEYQYDDRSNLVFAKNSDKKAVKLFYDRNGRPSSMIDQDKRQLTFKYNENGKPIEIADPKLGAITVSYQKSGEINKVDSPAGRKIALQVTSSFQVLLEILRPSGVSLSF